MIDEKYIVRINSNIRTVLEKYAVNGKNTVFVINDDYYLEGILTEGDVRLALLDGKSLESDIEGIINTDYTYAYIDESKDDIMHKFNQSIWIIPIIDRDHKLVDFCEFRNNVFLPIAQPVLGGNELNYVVEAVNSTWISSTGKYVSKFEQEFAKWCDNVKYGVATSNGTTALHLALVALGIGPGDEVIVPDLTFAATINAVIYTGATPVIVDIEEDGWCISVEEIKKAITDKTKAIIPVHVYGQPCDMDEIMDIANKNNLYVIEDCAEAHGAKYKGRKVGSFGHIGCFSFFANKVITTGEGGMCITNDEELNKKMRVFRDHGMSKDRKYYHEVIGFNYRMTNMQAAIGVAQLEKIDDTLKWREDLDNKYRYYLRDLKLISFQKKDIVDREKINWMVAVYTSSAEIREKILNEFKNNNVDTRAFFIPLSEMEIYKKYTFSNTNCKRISELGFNLPTSSIVSENDIIRIHDIIKGIEKLESI